MNRKAPVRKCRGLNYVSSPNALIRSRRALLSVSDQVNQHHDEHGEQHGDDEEIAKDFDADLAAGHSRSIIPCQRARLVPIKIRSRETAWGLLVALQRTFANLWGRMAELGNKFMQLADCKGKGEQDKDDRHCDQPSRQRY